MRIIIFIENSMIVNCNNGQYFLLQIIKKKFVVDKKSEIRNQKFYEKICN